MGDAVGRRAEVRDGLRALATRAACLRERLGSSRGATLLLLGTVSAVLSAVYVDYYLRGGPRIIDATSYYLQARTFASGQLAFEPPGPLASFVGRFLLPTPDGRLAVIFPPGYPALLSLGFLVGAPLAVGPMLAAGLSVATYLLAEALWGDPRVARAAGWLSALCGVLRYHTADTMSHGLCALLYACCLLLALKRSAAAHLLGGLLLGWLAATRPVSAFGCALVIAVVLSQRLARGTLPFRAVCGWLSASVGVGALLWQQHATTGQWGLSTQYLYYSLADGPVGCFRWGFGEHIGCQNEHGAFVAKYLPDGYGVRAALGTTLRRLQMHMHDACNIWGGPLLALAGFGIARKRLQGACLGGGILAHMALYAGFYFDGNYPGGGARMFADILPLEHILIAVAVVNLKADRWLPAMLVAAFALVGRGQHEALAAREGGRPMYEADVVERGTAKPHKRGTLVLVDTDHGFNLGYDPRRSPEVVIARRRDDASDLALMRALNRDVAFTYEFNPYAAVGSPQVRRHRPPNARAFTAASLWPPVTLSGGWLEQSSVIVDGNPHRALLAHAPQAVAARFLVPLGRCSACRVRVALKSPPEAAPSLRLNGAVLALAPTRGGENTLWLSEPLAVDAEISTLTLGLGGGTALYAVELIR